MFVITIEEWPAPRSSGRGVDQRFSPVRLSSATIVFVGPPGVQMRLSPSMVTDSLYPQLSAFLPSKSFFRSLRQSSSPVVRQQINMPCGVMTYRRSPSTVGVLRELCQSGLPWFHASPVFVFQSCLPSARLKQTRYSSLSSAVEGASPSV